MSQKVSTVSESGAWVAIKAFLLSLCSDYGISLEATLM